MLSKTAKTILPFILVVFSLGLVFIVKWNWVAIPPTDIYDRNENVPPNYGRLQGTLYVEASASGTRGQEVWQGYNNTEVSIYRAMYSADGVPGAKLQKQDYTYGELAYQTKSYYDGVYQIDIVPGVYFIKIANQPDTGKNICLVKVDVSQTVQCDLAVKP